MRWSLFGNPKIVVSGVSSLSFVETLVWLDGQLPWWVADAPGKTELFSISRYVLQKKFADVLASLDLDDCGYTLGSLRAGEATDFFQHTRNLGELQYRGRWTAASTLQYYLMEAFSALVLLEKRVRN